MISLLVSIVILCLIVGLLLQLQPLAEFRNPIVIVTTIIIILLVCRHFGVLGAQL